MKLKLLAAVSFDLDTMDKSSSYCNASLNDCYVRTIGQILECVIDFFPMMQPLLFNHCTSVIYADKAKICLGKQLQQTFSRITKFTISIQCHTWIKRQFFLQILKTQQKFLKISELNLRLICGLFQVHYTTLVLLR